MKHSILTSLFQSALNAVNPYDAVLNNMQLNGSRLIVQGKSYQLNRFNKIIVIGAGKAASPMAQAVERIFGNRINSGIIIVKYGHIFPLEYIEQIEAGHPVPDREGIEGTNKIIKLLKGADEKTLVISLLSGGASSLLVSPAKGLTLDDKKTVTKMLLSAGASIEELNAVRKHISGIKGGRLAETAYPAKVISMILSDVIDNRLDVIASGPTVPDTSTFQDAEKAIEKYGLKDKLPLRVKRFLQKGVAGKIKDTPKKGERFFKKTRNIIIGSIWHAVDAAVKRAHETGFEPQVITSELCGEAVDAARYLAVRVLEVQNSMKKGAKPRCLISGGETTVVVKGNGLGGRNQELALAFAVEIEGIRGITMLSAGTDGTDGPTDAAGALVDGNTIPLARRLCIRPEAYLEDNDSYNFFKQLDLLSGKKHHLKTGPTGTNVMDIQIIIVEV